MSALILKVKTDNAGSSNDDQFTIPLKSGLTYNFTVTGDITGSPVSHSTDSDLTLTFPSGAGTYNIEIDGTFPAIYFNNGGDKLKLLEIVQWGTNTWETFEKSFYGCSNLTITAISVMRGMIVVV